MFAGNGTSSTHIFEGQHNACDDSGHKHYNPEDTEEALALGEVHLETETTNSLVYTHVTVQTHSGYLKLISSCSLAHRHTCYLCLEAEDGDGDADDGSDTQSQKHCFCVIITESKEQHSSFRRKQTG